MLKHRKLAGAVRGALISAVFTGASAAHAGAVYHVNNGYDSGPGSLRHGLESGASKIIIKPRVNTIEVGSTLVYQETAALTILGSGQTLDGRDMDETMLEVSEGANLTVTGLTLAGPGDYSINNQGGGKGILLSVPEDRTGVVKLNLAGVTVKGFGDHGVHVDDCDIEEGCGAGSGGAGSGSPASVDVNLLWVKVIDVGNGQFDADGVRVDERGEGDIVFDSVASKFRGVGADGVELDESGDGDVRIKATLNTFRANGGYCDPDEFDLPASGDEDFDEFHPSQTLDPSCVEDDDGEWVLDLDDGFDIDEAGDGSITGRVTNSRVISNLDEGLDFDEEGEGGFRLQLVNVRGYDNGDEGVKVSEEDGGNVAVKMHRSVILDNGDDGVQIEEEGEGNLTVTVTASTMQENNKADLKVEQSDGGAGVLKVRGSAIDEIDINDGVVIN